MNGEIRKARMTPSELRAIIAHLGLTQVGVARILGVTSRAVGMWVAGDRKVPELLAKVLRMIIAGKITVEDLDKA